VRARTPAGSLGGRLGTTPRELDRLFSTYFCATTTIRYRRSSKSSLFLATLFLTVAKDRMGSDCDGRWRCDYLPGNPLFQCGTGVAAAEALRSARPDDSHCRGDTAT
jgi:hypothetical protein